MVAKRFPYFFFKARSLFSAKYRGIIRVVENAIDFRLCLRNFFGELFQPVLVASIEAVSAFNIPCGNDVHISSVFGKGRLYIVPKG